MKKRKKIILGSITGVLALALAGGGFWAYKTFVPQETPIDKNATIACQQGMAPKSKNSC